EYRRVLTIREKTNDLVRKGSVLCDIGDLAFKESRLDEALQSYQEGLKVAGEVRRLDVSGRAKLGLAEIAFKNAEIPEAKRWATEALKDFGDLGPNKEREAAKQLLTNIERRSIVGSSSLAGLMQEVRQLMDQKGFSAEKNRTWEMLALIHS